MMNLRTFRVVAALTLSIAVSPSLTASGVDRSARLYSASDAIRQALVERIGAGADVTITALDVTGEAPIFREARPDPAARLGKPMRFNLMTADGARLAVTASAVVTISHAVARAALTRGHVVVADDVQAVRSVLAGIPIVRIPTAGAIVGTRVLRPIASGDVVLPSFVLLRRDVEPGDRVTVVALAGQIEVTATFLAADGGNAGDTIRVRNPDSKTFLRGRVVKTGLVEVLYER
jgi:flagella basal body P-ring formation protein FlgA